MDVGRAFGAPFKDRRWLGKIALGVLFTNIPFLGFAVSGWGIDYVRSSASGRDQELPEWSDFGGHWVKGLAFSLASVVYYSPVIVIFLMFVIPAFSAAAYSLGSLTDPFGTLGTAIGGVGAGLLFAALFSVAVSFFVSAARAHYAVRGNFGAAFDIAGILQAFRANPGGYFLAWIMEIVAVAGAVALAFALGAALGVVPCGGLIAIPIAGAMGLSLGMGANALLGQYAAGAYAIAPAGIAPSPVIPPPPPHYPVAAQAIPVVATEGYDPAAPPATMVGRAAVAEAVARASSQPKPASRYTPQDLESIVPLVRPESQDAPPRAAAAAPSAIVTEPVPDIVTEPIPVVDAAPEPVTEPIPVVAAAPEPVTEPLPVIVAESANVPASAPAHEPAPAPDLTARRQSEIGTVVSEIIPIDFPSDDPDAAADVVAGQEAAGPDVTADMSPVPAAPKPLEPAVAPASVPDEGPGPDLATPNHSGLFELRRVQGPGRAGERWVLPRAEVQIGRDRACFIALENDGKASRHHALLTFSSGVVRLLDLGSSNGTLLNGDRVKRELIELQPGDEITIGSTVLKLAEV